MFFKGRIIGMKINNLPEPASCTISKIGLIVHNNIYMTHSRAKLSTFAAC